MSPPQVERLDLDMASAGSGDNVTDWALERFQAEYGTHVTRDDIWEYVYGVMHAPDWRDRYAADLRRSFPRIPLAEDFEAFRAVGRRLMHLHIGYESVNEWPVVCEVDGVADDGTADGDAYRIERQMRWGRDSDKREDRAVLVVNSRCRLVGIPAEAEKYKVSGRSPLQWAIGSLCLKGDDVAGTVDNPNLCDEWADEPFNLIRHLRRLVTVSVESARIVASLPPALTAAPTTDTDVGEQ